MSVAVAEDTTLGQPPPDPPPATGKGLRRQLEDTLAANSVLGRRIAALETELRSALPPDVVYDALALAGDLRAVLAGAGVAEEDATAVLGDVGVRAVQMVAVARRRTGQLEDADAPPIRGARPSRSRDGTADPGCRRVGPAVRG